MRRAIGMQMLVLLLATALALPDARPDSGQLQSLREHLDEAETRADWDRAALDLLAGLDAAGRSDSSEAAWLVSRLVESRPEDPELLWRSAEASRRQPDDARAIETLERLVELHPQHELGRRARRALPALYLKTGMLAKSARADELLIREGLGDPVAVLNRLAKTYATMDQPSRVIDALDRLARLDPTRARYDAELMWLRVSNSERLAPREETARSMLEFANLFPWHSRRPDALLASARAWADAGKPQAALAIAEEAVAAGRGSALAVDARLLRGELLEGALRPDDARAEYGALLEDAVDPRQAGLAVQRLIDIEVEQRGAESALLMLAGLADQGDRLTRPIARAHFQRLLGAMEERLLEDPRHSAFWLALSQKIEIDPVVLPELTLAAASSRDAVGDHLGAARLFRRAGSSSGLDTTNRERVAVGLARSEPGAGDARGEGAGATLPARLAEYERRGDRAAIRALVDEFESLEALSAADFERSLTIAARAEFTEAETARVRELLEGHDLATPASLVVRGDARALDGLRLEACRDYRLAAHSATIAGPARPALEISLASWLEVRLARCALLEGDADAAQRRLVALLEGDVSEPARLAATELLRRIPGAVDSILKGAAEPPS